MKVLFFGIIIFFLAFLLHFIIWKVRLPRRQTLTLLLVFFGILSFSIFFLFVLTRLFVSTRIYCPFTIAEYLHIFIFFTAMTLAYITTYSAIEVDSPSLVMIAAIYKAGKNGIAASDFNKMMTNGLLIMPRIRDLLEDKLIYKDAEKYRLSHRGSLIASIFIFYRKLLKSPKGG